MVNIMFEVIDKLSEGHILLFPSSTFDYTVNIKKLCGVCVVVVTLLSSSFIWMLDFLKWSNVSSCGPAIGNEAIQKDCDL